MSARRDRDTVSATLLEGLREKDPQAWSRMVTVYGPIVYAWCRRAGLREHDAADLVQDVFASVSKSIGRFHRNESTDSFSGWLSTITHNGIRDFFRRNSVRPEAFGGTDAQLQIASVPQPDELSSSFSFGAAVSQRVLSSVQSEFEPRTWDAFWRSTVDDRSPADVADELGVSVDVVYQARSRVLRRLRRRMSELPE